MRSRCCRWLIGGGRLRISTCSYGDLADGAFCLRPIEDVKRQPKANDRPKKEHLVDHMSHVRVGKVHVGVGGEGVDVRNGDADRRAVQQQQTEQSDRFEVAVQPAEHQPEQHKRCQQHDAAPRRKFGYVKTRNDHFVRTVRKGDRPYRQRKRIQRRRR